MKFLRWFLGKLILSLDALFPPRALERSPEAQRKVDEALTGLSIYEFTACPFCVKVRRYMKGASIALPLRDAKTQPYQSELLQGGGKLQVPCLRIESPAGAIEWLYESSDIIAYLEKRIASSQ